MKKLKLVKKKKQLEAIHLTFSRENDQESMKACDHVAMTHCANPNIKGDQ